MGNTFSRGRSDTATSLNRYGTISFFGTRNPSHLPPHLRCVSTTGVRRILVPLADEPIDDATFQQVFDLAQIAGSTIRLLYVRAGRAPSAGEEASSLREMARIAARSAGVPVQRVVRFGDVDTAILREAAHWPADVVALTAGDPAWLSRAVRSGKAARAFRDGGIPALLYTPRTIPSAA